MSTMDEHGLIPESLREHIARLQGSGRRIKFLYTVPTFQQPRRASRSPGSAASRCSRSRGQNDILVLEDNPYGLLYFDAGRRRRRCARSRGRRDLPRHVLEDARARASGSAGPLAPHAIREKLILANEAAVLSPELVHARWSSRSTCRRADWKGQIDTFRGVYRERRDAMLARAARAPADLQLDRPQRRLLRLAHAARLPRLEGDAAARGQGAGRLHPGHGVLRRRGRAQLHAAVVLLPDARLHPGGHPPARHRHQRRARAC